MLPLLSLKVSIAGVVSLEEATGSYTIAFTYVPVLLQGAELKGMPDRRLRLRRR
jgi:hypothetical protein